ncbi:D-alanyl-D-alanine carboxypeptidase [Algimonas arctica]|uniref:serine-type D-Ala-D-Ala carboxypeptidase n=1 Tax=Algimonas arctica TaxID=1479486 RepID=A0A8J3CP40_9PROT|nr:D-alanyl-D-alanine carboxypeptidase family protein [Algimonas arctica]GHA84095.1 D-alanyl-D-alanine carboxypeptidase [Algimonas arctica]
MFRPLFFTALFVPVAAYGAPIQTDAKQAVIIDHATGIVLFEKEARAPMPPASMTKIMTVQMVLEAIERVDLTYETKLLVSDDAWRRGGAASGSSTMFLDPRSEVRVEDLLRGLIIQSGNDAAITFAEALSGSESAFADAMTRRAHEMGLDSATFRNATGWPNDEHEISALDLAKLTRKQIEDFPAAYAIYSEPDFTWNGTKQGNRNPLLGVFPGADGVKTGATSVAGYGLVASAVRDDERRIIVFNGTDGKSQRSRVAKELMSAAFNEFDVLSLYRSGDRLEDIPVYMGKAKTVGLVLREDVNIGYQRSDRNAVKARIDFTPAPAPVVEGSKIAELVVVKGDVEVARYPLYASDTVARKGLFGRVGASLLQKIRG